ncbi:Proline-tRNA ligase [Zancudomyces culisetae]|uniref:Proline-tRNA ligase n=1 Tax=Zancudomyces culisetae TaxID=1213189 RepID=A0A1R1PCB9_ZANCU|nr:Proline-tRNA ligase [Zancudomyces culisetae]OMH81094.1 Proline-tRNA ligase [Zancudomyces culisetae]|eukprot:OMH78616.1 Proline-tRNA ligase [Zancudomyces culisetae]
MRPRSELLRCKEFLMKDMYSFDSNENDALESYKRVREAYNNIFKRIGADFAVADADSGDIGGSLSQEYHILSKDGEDTLIKCNSCSAVSNEEKAVGVVPQNIRVDSKSAITKNMENGSFNLSLSVHGFKYSINGEKIINLFLLPVGRQPNTVKCNKAITKNSNTSNNVTGDSSGNRQAELGILEFSFVDGVEIEKLREIVGDTSSTEIFIDKQTLLDPENAQALAKNLSIHLNLVVNQKNNRGKGDANGVYTGDYTEIKQGDFCEPCFNGANHKSTGIENRPKLVAQRAIEVGHIFYLGTKYSIPLGANLTNKVNKLVPAEMGCYGIGVMRTVQAVADWSRFNSSTGSVEAGNVNNRLVWPVSISPYSVCIIPFEVNKKRLDLPFDTYEQLVNSGVQRITGELSALKSRRGHKFTPGNTHAHNNDGGYDCSYGNSGSLFSPENLVVDDRLYLSNGYRLTDSEIIGFPFVIVLGNDYFNSGHQNIELRVNTLKNKTVSQYNEHESAIPSSTTPDGTIVFKNLPINRIGETIIKFL